MKKILFVDDEPLVLLGLQRSMRGMRGEWDMEFASSGVEALELMSCEKFDVIVSDMRMPGMNGARLLNEVMSRYPSTVRLILSGHADQDLIMRCVGSTHQYLTKPCNPDALKATIHRASAVGESLKDTKLQFLVTQMRNLPSLPSLYVQMTEALHAGEASSEEIGGIIANDTGMCEKLLTLVNSEFFGRKQRISNSVEATTFLGVDTVKSLVLCLHTFSNLDQCRLPGLPLDVLWKHSLRTASYARAVARLMRCQQKLVDEAYVSGLLHDAGRLLLASNFPDQYNSMVAYAAGCKLNMIEAEREKFGATHAEIGGYLLGLWGLPVPVVEAIALHHSPSHTTNMEFSPLTAVHVADVLAHEVEATLEAESKPQFDASYLKLVEVDQHIDLWRDTIREEHRGVA